MTLEELHNTDFYKTAVDIVKKAIDYIPPTMMYKFKDSGKQCYILSYDFNDEDTDFMKVTLTVQKTGKDASMTPLGFENLHQNKVFNVKLDDLEPWETNNNK